MVTVTVNLCCRLNNSPSRHRLNNINTSSRIGSVRQDFANVMNVSPHSFDLVYAGQLLRDDKPLEFYGIKAGVTVYAVKALHPVKERSEPEPMDDAAVSNVVTALQTALINPAFRSIVEKMLTDTETMENLIIAVPDLDEDPVAIAMLQDPELLAMLADPKQIKQVIEAHPCLGQAALYVAAAVSEEGAKMDASNQATAGSYSLDRMSDEDDETDEAAQRSRTTSRPAGSEITANQLAAALAAAGATPPQASTSSSGRGGVSLDFLQQAMQQAQSSMSPSESQQSSQSSTSSSSSRPSLQAQLQQMRDMGITDESVARRALDAAGGNVQAALEFIFGDGME